MSQGDYLLSPGGAYQLMMQTDGNLVLYYGGTALWATGTYAPSDDYALLQTDGNLVIYTSSAAIWASNTAQEPGDGLYVQDDGNVVIYQGSTALWNTATAANIRDCWVADNCNRGEFAWEALSIYPQSPYNGANGAMTMAGNFSVLTWEDAENTAAACNPLATTQVEPGSYPLPGNSARVQEYQNYDGQTCWYWGITATGVTMLNGHYPDILSVLRGSQEANGAWTECVLLARAVGNDRWGTGDFEADC
ncbi:MAG: hypothetical protein ACRDYY_00755 [Acidimicrobiales bacterium]